MIIEKFETTAGWDDKEFTGESLLSEQRPRIVVNNNPGIPTDFLIGGTSHPVVSDRIKSILEKLPGSASLEFIPTTIENYDQATKYWVLNILGFTDCFDYDKSKYTIHERSKSIRKILKMYFREDVIQGKNIFRIYETPISLFISDNLINIFKNEKVTGYAIEPLTGH